MTGITPPVTRGHRTESTPAAGDAVTRMLGLLAVVVAAPTALATLFVGWTLPLQNSSWEGLTEQERLVANLSGQALAFLLMAVALIVVVATAAGVRGGRGRHLGMIAGTVAAFTLPTVLALGLIHTLVSTVIPWA
jgi:hypothetical protein